MEIKSIQNSLIDYPGNICITLFTGGCNYRCPFCQNRDLVLNPGTIKNIEENLVLSKITKRAKLIDGVTITGGEPLLNNDIGDFISKIKQMNLKVKIDTNGSFPEKLLCLRL